MATLVTENKMVTYIYDQIDINWALLIYRPSNNLKILKKYISSINKFV